VPWNTSINGYTVPLVTRADGERLVAFEMWGGREWKRTVGQTK